MPLSYICSVEYLPPKVWKRYIHTHIRQLKSFQFYEFIFVDSRRWYGFCCILSKCHYVCICEIFPDFTGKNRFTWVHGESGC